MRWHVEIILETILFLVLVFRRSGLRYFDILIGIDLSSQLLQIIPYRSHYPAFSALFWRSGVVLIAAARLLALVESSQIPRSVVNWWHVRILAFWTAGVTACAWLEVGQRNAVIFKVNTALLIIQAVSYLAWCVVFLLDKD